MPNVRLIHLDWKTEVQVHIIFDKKVSKKYRRVHETETTFTIGVCKGLNRFPCPPAPELPVLFLFIGTYVFYVVIQYKLAVVS